MLHFSVSFHSVALHISHERCNTICCFLNFVDWFGYNKCFYHLRFSQFLYSAKNVLPPDSSLRFNKKKTKITINKNNNKIIFAWCLHMGSEKPSLCFCDRDELKIYKFLKWNYASYIMFLSLSFKLFTSVSLSHLLLMNYNLLCAFITAFRIDSNPYRKTPNKTNIFVMWMYVCECMSIHKNVK